VKIGPKLIAAFSAVALICGLVGGIGFYSVQKGATNTKTIVEEQMPSVTALLEIQIAGEEASAILNGLQNLRMSKEQRDSSIADLGELRKRYVASFETYESLVKDPEDIAKWEEFKQEWSDWRAANIQFMEGLKQIWALDLGDPVEFQEILAELQGEQYKLETKVMEMLIKGEAYEGDTSHSKSAFGKWKETFSSSNPEVLKHLDAMSEPHKRFHKGIAQAQRHVRMGEVDRAKYVFRTEIETSAALLIENYKALAAIAEHGHEIANQARHQASIVCAGHREISTELLSTLVDRKLAQAKNVVDNASKTANTSKILTLSAVIIGAVIALAFGIIIARSITKPMLAIVARIKDIAEGEGDLTQRVEVHSKDELGELGKWFNTFVGKVHDIVAAVNGVSLEVANATEELSTNSAGMANSMDGSSAQVREMSSAIEQMSASIVEEARKSGDAARSADESRQVARSGGEVVEKTITGMRAIDEAVQASANSVTQLGKRGEQIGEVITVINDIADQTNLLALNAAIEAARAGEHGRGFAVVADEVRKLADRTTKATEEIAESIRAIQDETHLAVERMNTGTEQVNEGVTQATEAGQSLSQIVSSADELTMVIQSIAAAAEEQSAASEQISRNVESVSTATEEVSRGAGEASESVKRLAVKAEQLREMMSRFKMHAQDRRQSDQGPPPGQPDRRVKA